jgi:hypothetical protein
VATEAAWLDGEKGKNHGKSKKLLTGIGLLMEGVRWRGSVKDVIRKELQELSRMVRRPAPRF